MLQYENITQNKIMATAHSSYYKNSENDDSFENPYGLAQLCEIYS